MHNWRLGVLSLWLSHSSIVRCCWISPLCIHPRTWLILPRKVVTACYHLMVRGQQEGWVGTPSEYCHIATSTMKQTLLFHVCSTRRTRQITHSWTERLTADPMPVGLPVFQPYIYGVTPVRMPIFAPSVCLYVPCPFSQANPYVGKQWYTDVQVAAVSTYFAWLWHINVSFSIYEPIYYDSKMPTIFVCNMNSMRMLGVTEVKH